MNNLKKYHILRSWDERKEEVRGFRPKSQEVALGKDIPLSAVEKRFLEKILKTEIVELSQISDSLLGSFWFGKLLSIGCVGVTGGEGKKTLYLRERERVEKFFKKRKEREKKPKTT